MIVKIDKSFERDTDRIRDKKLNHKIAIVIENCQQSSKFSQIRGIKKLQGSSEYYRIRIGNYRLGIQIIGNLIIFERCLHRKEIYKYFPKF